MKALTLTQPWATLVAIGAKRIETRSWSTSYRGRLAIHAAKRFPADDRDLVYTSVFRNALAPYLAERASFFGLQKLENYLPLGHIVATCTLANVLPVTMVDNENNVWSVSLPPLSEQERAFGNYDPGGRFAWILEDVRILPEPIPAKGKLSLWEWEPAAPAESSTAAEAGSQPLVKLPPGGQS